jgi:hypothetical protein
MVKIKCSSLIEVIVAMTLITFVVTAGMMVILKTTHAGFSDQHLRSFLRINEIIIETIQDRKYIEEDIEDEDIVFHKRLHFYKTNVFTLEVTAVSKDGRFLSMQKQLISLQ